MTLNVFNWKWIFVTRLRFALFNVSNETRLVVCEGVRLYRKFPLRRSHVAWTQAVLRCDFICDRQMGVNTLAYARCKLKYWCRNSDLYCNFTRWSIICTGIKINWNNPTLLALIEVLVFAIKIKIVSLSLYWLFEVGLVKWDPWHKYLLFTGKIICLMKVNELEDWQNATI